MKFTRWSIVVIVLYAVFLTMLLFPILGALADDSSGFPFIERYIDVLLGSILDLDVDPEALGIYWTGAGVLILAQALLLFVAADDGKRQRRKPRQHVFIAVAAATISVGVISLAAFWSVLMAFFGDDALNSGAALLLSPLAFWAFWGVVFYVYRHRLSKAIERLLGWLLKGSILELLIAVPAHIVTRQRDDCCAPALTLAGIATGLAVMLMTFGPGVLLLYRRRIEDKRRSHLNTSEETNAKEG